MSLNVEDTNTRIARFPVIVKSFILENILRSEDFPRAALRLSSFSLPAGSLRWCLTAGLYGSIGKALYQALLAVAMRF
jgi:hypothetical protein